MTVTVGKIKTNRIFNFVFPFKKKKINECNVSNLILFSSTQERPSHSGVHYFKDVNREMTVKPTTTYSVPLRSSEKVSTL